MAPCGPGGPRGPGNPGAPAIPGAPFKEQRKVTMTYEHKVKQESVNADIRLTADPLAPGIPSVPGLPCINREEEAMHQTVDNSVM